MTITLLSPLKSDAAEDRLADGLVAYLASTGLPLPEDGCLLKHIRTAMQFGSMQAVLAVSDGEAVGVVAWRVEHDAGFIVLFYVLPDVPVASAEALLAQAMSALQRKNTPLGIYAELPAESQAVLAALQRNGFVGVERVIMACDLTANTWSVEVPAAYDLVKWQPAAVHAAARVLYEANRGTIDSLIIPELQSLKTTQVIVEQTLKGRYGDFDPNASGMVYHRNGDLVGVTLVTRRHVGQGFTAEICVLPEHRRRGLAHALMCHTHQELLAQGLTHNTLGVTATNPARALYAALGYRPVGRVCTYVWPRPANWPL
ncbi:MAG: hypothetical protein Kow0077_30180 [Anaerolineae bacterium]